MPKHPVKVLSIAGSDPSGGAGIQADLKTFSALGAYGMAVITSLTAQNTMRVSCIHTPPPAFLKNQLEAVFDDIPPDAVKIGMLYGIEEMKVVEKILKKYKPPNVILDPVMVSTSGDKLQDKNSVTFLKENLFPLVNFITPNLQETEILFGSENLKLIKTPLLIKGGHSDNNHCDDHLYINGELYILPGKKIKTKSTHGTGCTLSSAIAVYLAQGKSLLNAAESAKKYVTNAIKKGTKLNIGNGSGPLDHRV